MRAIGINLFFLLLFVALCAFVIKTVPVRIQTALQSTLQQQFDENQLPAVQISMDGRDVLLTGAVDSQEQINQAIKLAANVVGVRVVMTELELQDQNVTSDSAETELPETE